MPRIIKHGKVDKNHYTKFVMSCMLYAVYQNVDAALCMEDKKKFLDNYEDKNLHRPHGKFDVERALKNVGKSAFSQYFFKINKVNARLNQFVLNEEMRTFLKEHEGCSFEDFLFAADSKIRGFAKSEKEMCLQLWAEQSDLIITTVNDVLKSRKSAVITDFKAYEILEESSADNNNNSSSVATLGFFAHPEINCPIVDYDFSIPASLILP